MQRVSSIRASQRPFSNGKVVARSRSVATKAAATPVVTPSVQFNNGNATRFAPIINGCWQFAGGHGRDVFEGLPEKLQAHAAAGLTTFDTADIYGPSEQILGQFQKSWVEAGNAPLQILTKYVPNIFQSRVTPASVEGSIKKSLAALQMDSLDCVQMHWWDYNIPGMVDAAKSLADLQAKGLIKNLGTTNMDTQALAAIVDAGVPVVCNQVQFSLLDRRPLNGMLDYCGKRGIKVFSYGSVAGGLLSDKHVAEPKAGLFGRVSYPNVDLNTSSLKMYWNVCSQFGGQPLWRELLAVLRTVADRHDVSVANVALRWVMQAGDGSTVHPIVGLRSAAHIADNARVLSFSLTAQDLADIDQVLARAEGPKGDCYSFERGM